MWCSVLLCCVNGDDYGCYTVGAGGMHGKRYHTLDEESARQARGVFLDESILHNISCRAKQQQLQGRLC
jgi:hypothetical protein